MEDLKKLPAIFILSTLLIFTITACGEEEEIPPSPYLKDLISVQDAEVWIHNWNNPLIISSEYYRSKGTSTIDGIIRNPGGVEECIGSSTGELTDGILNISCGELLASELLGWNDWKKYFREWDKVTIDDEETKANVLWIKHEGVSTNPYLNKEKMSGSYDSLWLESIIFLYVEKDCHIEGVHGKRGYKNGDSFYESAADLDLDLRKGWNTLCRKQALVAGNGSEYLSIELKNPDDFIWVLY